MREKCDKTIVRKDKKKFYIEVDNDLSDKGYKIASVMNGSNKIDINGKRHKIVPLDQVYIYGKIIVTTEKKSTAELYNEGRCVVVPSGNGLKDDYIKPARTDAVDRMRKGEIGRITAAHLIHLAQAFVRTQQFVEELWTADTINDTINPALKTVKVGYSVEPSEENNVKKALTILRIKASGYQIVSGKNSVTFIFG
jgi:hypothetical protein